MAKKKGKFIGEKMIELFHEMEQELFLLSFGILTGYKFGGGI